MQNSLYSSASEIPSDTLNEKFWSFDLEASTFSQFAKQVTSHDLNPI